MSYSYSYDSISYRISANVTAKIIYKIVSGLTQWICNLKEFLHKNTSSDFSKTSQPYEPLSFSLKKRKGYNTDKLSVVHDVVQVVITSLPALTIQSQIFHYYSWPKLKMLLNTFISKIPHILWQIHELIKFSSDRKSVRSNFCM